MIGLGIVIALILVAIFAPVLAPYEPTDILIGKEDVSRYQAPCIHLLGCPDDQPQHIMGIDGNVRDEFSRIIYGSRISLTLGFFTVTLALVVGSLIGALAGYRGGWLDNVMMRIMDVVLGFPALLLAIAIVAVLGPGLENALLAIAIVSLPQYARVMRAQVLTIREADFVSASRALGASARHILFRRVIPNALTPLVVLATLGVATAILEAAGLSFLGLGAQPPTAEWGSMLASERNQVFTAPHLVFYPGLAIMLTVLGFNLMGDGLRDALDPTLNK
jgi:ABC-type dipeptide/oligopeptide/nickel transport system permease subunit